MWWPRQVVAYPWEKLSDLRQAIYPEGFYNVRGPSALGNLGLGFGCYACFLAFQYNFDVLPSRRCHMQTSCKAAG